MADDYKVKEATGLTIELTSKNITGIKHVPTHLHYMPASAPSGVCDPIGVAAASLFGAGQALQGPVTIRYDPTSGPEPIWIGDSTVTVNDGWPLYPGEQATFNIDNLGNLWAITTGANKQAFWVQGEGA